MRSVITGIIAATLIAVVAAFVLDGRVQAPANEAYQTQGVRL
jgi:hypothetical protein